MISFAYPELISLLILPVLIYYLLPVVKGIHGDALRIPFLQDLIKINLKSGSLWQGKTTSYEKQYSISKICLFLIYMLLTLAVMRPRWAGEPIRIKNEGRDILLVLDISTSMLEPDFSLGGRRINRLQAVKLAASEFIDKRRDDRIGLILFGSLAYLQSPLTFDKEAVKNILFSMDAGMAGKSTAIGDALGLALKTIKDGQDKDNKVIILLSDGENNDGSLSLPQAINLAKDENVKIYTIGVGNESSFVQSILSYKVKLPTGLDEAGLKTIADEAGGSYFRASNTDSLIKVYEEIDKLEPRSHEEAYIQEIREYYYIPLLTAIMLGLVLMIIRRRQM